MIALMLLALLIGATVLGLVAISRKRAHRLSLNRAAFVNLVGESALLKIDEDRAALAPLFHDVVDEDQNCDVAFVYCRLSEQGEVLGTSRTLREVARSCKARLLVVALENDGKSYVNAVQRRSGHAVSMILTLNRKGSAFAGFLKELLEETAKGVPIDRAWCSLAPQSSEQHGPTVPEAIFVHEV